MAAGRAGMRAGPGRGEEGSAGGRGPGSASPRRLGPGCALPSSPRTAPSPLLPDPGRSPRLRGTDGAGKVDGEGGAREGVKGVGWAAEGVSCVSDVCFWPRR